MSAPPKPLPDLFIRLSGRGIKPWVVPMRTLASVMNAVQRLVDQNDDEIEVEAEEETVDVRAVEGESPIDLAERSLRLVQVKSGSAVYGVTTAAPTSSLSIISDTGRSIENPANAAWSGSTISSLKELSEVARSQGCNIELCEAKNGRYVGDVLARICPLTFHEVSESAFVRGITSVYGRLERIGGATELRCGLRVTDQPRMVFCDIAGIDLIRKMGPHLYEDIFVSGEATWLRHNWHLRTMKITSFEPPKTGSILDVLDRMHELGGHGWDKVRDPDKLIAGMRGA